MLEKTLFVTSRMKDCVDGRSRPSVPQSTAGKGVREETSCPAVDPRPTTPLEQLQVRRPEGTEKVGSQNVGKMEF